MSTFRNGLGHVQPIGDVILCRGLPKSQGPVPSLGTRVWHTVTNYINTIDSETLAAECVAWVKG